MWCQEKSTLLLFLALPLMQFPLTEIEDVDSKVLRFGASEVWSKNHNSTTESFFFFGGGGGGPPGNKHKFCRRKQGGIVLFTAKQSLF